MKHITTLSLAAAVLFSLASCQNKTKTAEAAPQTAITPVVKAIEATAMDVATTETFTATIEPNIVNNIASQSAGRIKRIYVEIGDEVKKGQLLAEMDAINLQKTHMQMVNDSIELGRLTELYKIGGIAQADYDLAVLNYEIVKKTYSNLLENTRLISPVDGIITARNYDVNDMYAMSQPLFVVEQIKPVKMIINISESRFTKIRTGMEVEIKADAYPGETFKGKVSLLYPTVNSTTHTFPVEVLVDNADKKLRPGMFARVSVNFGSNYHVVVPDVAVVKQIGSGEHFIYVLQPDNTVKYQLVEIGKRMGSTYEIVSGISIGDMIVTEGHARLKNGINVIVK